MEWFLQQQAEKSQEQKVSRREPALASPVVYFSTWRTTSSDVLSLVTTATPFSRPATWSSKSDHERRKSRSKFSESKFYSPLCVDAAVNDLERANTNKALWQEKERFSTRLRARRIDREILETAAAIKVQALARGIVARNLLQSESRVALARKRLRRSYAGVIMKLRVKKFVEANVSETRGRATNAVVAIQNQWRKFLANRLTSKERLTRRQELLNRIAVCLQCMVRRRIACRATGKLRMRHFELQRATGSQLVQNFARAQSAKKILSRKRLLLQYVAATMIQRCVRVHLARKAFRKRKVLASVLRVNSSAIPIQAIFRGQLHRRYVRVLRMQEKKDLIFAAALTVQRAFRGHLGRLKYQAELQRTDTENVVAACILVQRALKGHIGRAMATEQRSARNSDLFAQARLGNVRTVEDILAGLIVGDEVYELNSVNSDGMSALCVAAKWGHKKLVKKLVSLGTDLNLKDASGHDALHFALKHAHVKDGVPSDPPEGNGVAELLIAKGISIALDSRTPLHDAALYGCIEPIRFLLQKPIDVNVQDSNCVTPLHESVRGNHIECAKLLVTRNANVNAVDSNGTAPLHLAASNGNMDLVEFLVEQSADLAVQDSESRTPWRRALVNDHTAVAQYLQKCWSDMIAGQGSSST